MRMRRGSEVVDDPWWFVESYYRAQAVGVPDGAGAAFEHFTRTGRAAGLAPNPVHDVVGRTFPVEGDQVELLPLRSNVDVATWLVTHPGLKHRELARSILDAARADGSTAVFRSPVDLPMTWDAFLQHAQLLGADGERIRAAGVFDHELYVALTGIGFASAAAALWHYLEVGALEGLCPHPFFHPILQGGPVDPRALPKALAAEETGRHPNPLLDAHGPPDDRSGLRRRLLDAAATSLRRPPERRSAASLTGRPRPRSTAVHPDLLVLLSASELTGRTARIASSLLRQTHSAWRLVVLLGPGPTPWRQGVVDALLVLDERIGVAEVDDPGAWPRQVVAQHPGHAVLVWDGHTDYRPDAFDSLLNGLAPDGAVRGWTSADATTLTGLTLTSPATSTRDLLEAPPVLSGTVLGPDLVTRATDLDFPGLDCTAWALLLDAAGREAVSVAAMLAGRSARPVAPSPTHADAVRAHAAPPDPGSGAGPSAGAGLSLLVSASSSDPAAIAQVVRTSAENGPVTDVVLTAAGEPALTAALVALLVDVTDVVVADGGAEGFGLRTARALARARGDVVAIAPDGLPAGSTWPARCLEAVRAGADVAVPVALTRTGTIRSAGVACHPGTDGVHLLLSGHPVDDAHLADGLEVHGAMSPGLVARRSVIVASTEASRPTAIAAAVRGARAVAVAECVTDDDTTTPDVPASVGVEAAPDPLHALCERAGWSRVGISSQGTAGWRPLLVRERLARARSDRPRLRWALKNPAPSTPRGDRWGDTFFLDSLARALRRLDQEVVVDRAEAHRRPSSDQLDDVTLTLRGRVPHAPVPGRTNILWVISHPDDVPDDEVAAFDLVYGASRPWAEAAASRTGRQVRPLLQATDAQRFHPDLPAADDVPADRVLFIGNHRGAGRPVIDDLVAVEAPLQVHGARWDGTRAASFVASTFVPNEDVAGYYRAARLVANDHWPDMAAQGFVSNRAFDAAATGALVVSDPVAGGFDDLFGLVRSYASQAELADLLAGPDWLTPSERDAAARRVVAEHSFEARAAALLDDVLALREGAG